MQNNDIIDRAQLNFLKDQNMHYKRKPPRQIDLGGSQELDEHEIELDIKHQDDEILVNGGAYPMPIVDNVEDEEDTDGLKSKTHQRNGSLLQQNWRPQG